MDSLSHRRDNDRQRPPRVAILGAGPAGLGAAWQLVRQRQAEVVVLEQREAVGGNAGSFTLEGLEVDYGSHRLHPSCHPRILDDLRTLLGDDLLDRPRHGRIRLRNRWIHFPLKPQDLVLHLPWSFAAGVAQDSLRKMAPRKPHANGARENFASVIEHGLGSTICRDFYLPYAKKIWGVAPEALSATQARRRVSANSLGKMARKALGLAAPNGNSPRAGRFYYPRHGFGQISRALADAALALGAQIHLGATVRRLRLGAPHHIEYESGGETRSLAADHIWSTIPLTTLARLTDPAPPAHVLEASRQIGFRAMILVYLVLDCPQWTPFDAHYFPESEIKLTRLSEPKNYSGQAGRSDQTVLCGELPCQVDDATWRASDEELAALVRDSLDRCGLPLNGSVTRVVTRRLSHAYPIYLEGYEAPFKALDEWAGGLERVLTFGRQGLFAHDNTHHALAMAYGAVDCLEENGEFDTARWHTYRAEFAKHVVED